MRKLQLDTVVRRAQIAYGGTKTEAELREVRREPPRGVSGPEDHEICPGSARPRARPHPRPPSREPAPVRPPLLHIQMAAHDPAGLIREAIMDEASEEAQQAFSDAQSRARDVEMLVRSLNEVAALFQDLAVLVQHQSEMLDSIEENVETAGACRGGGGAALAR